MFIYYLLYFIPFVFVLTTKDNASQLDLIQLQTKQNIFPWLLIGVVYIIIIGYRDMVGGDWGAYQRHFDFISYFNVSDIIKRSDPGYYLINWFMQDWGYDIYSVNLICGAIFMTGLIIFARRQPNPWLAIAVATPYLVVVVAMGYTRQAVALGLMFWGLTALEKKQFKQFLVLMVLAATFHKSAVLMIGLGIFLQGNGRLIRVLAVVIVAAGIYNAFLADYQDDLWKNYVEVQMQSQGAMIRVAMNFLPSVIFLLFRKRWKQQFDDYSFWVMIAIGSLISVGLVNFASTAVDRVALYFTPIQVVVYSRLPYLLRDRFNPQLITFSILIYYLIVLYVWLNYATHARYWVPYCNALFDGVF